VRLSMVPKILEGSLPVTRLMMLLMVAPFTEEVPVVKVTPVLGTLNWLKLWNRLPPETVPVPVGAIALPLTTVWVVPSVLI